MVRHGGFLVAPSGTCFGRLRDDESYRRAMLAADLAIADSGLMVRIWRLLRRKQIQRISGLKYLQQLLAKLKGEGAAEIFWSLPSQRARQKLMDWSRRNAFLVKIDNCYVAPKYGLEIEDRNLLAHEAKRRSAQMGIGLRRGAQERIIHYPRENLSDDPENDVRRAALGFITG